jgi:hypothetical protein
VGDVTPRPAPARSRTAEAKRAAEQRRDASPLERVGGVAGKTVLTSLGATLAATERVADVLGTYTDRARAERELALQRKRLERELTRFERRGDSARRALGRDVTRARARIERELREQRARVERDARGLTRRVSSLV